MADPEERIPEPEVTSKEMPRFMKAIRATEKFLESADELTKTGYFGRPPDLARVAQDFDFVTGSTGAHVQGDTSELITAAARRLKDSIANYLGPTEIAQIYSELYFDAIREILGK